MGFGPVFQEWVILHFETFTADHWEAVRRDNIFRERC
jgi:hypothetical protein